MNKLARLSLTTLLLLAAGRPQSTPAQEMKTAMKTRSTTGVADPASIERGRYIVESVVICGRCHSQRNAKGELMHTNWLQGASVWIQPTYDIADWALVAPRIAGSPPGTEAEFVRLLTTGISRTGKPPKQPMPSFRMTRQDAESVLAYLKSLAR